MEVSEAGEASEAPGSRPPVCGNPAGIQVGPLALNHKASGQARPPPDKGRGYPFQMFYLTLVSGWARLCLSSSVTSAFPDQEVETKRHC